MTRFEEDRDAKLKRILGLRIINALGMIAWREDQWGCAQQKLRMLHPLSWVWFLVLVLLAVVMHGVVEVAKEIKRLPEELVWW